MTIDSARSIPAIAAAVALLLALPAAAAAGGAPYYYPPSPGTARTATAYQYASSSCANLPWAQCGGEQHTGPRCCPLGYDCVVQDQWYSQCKPVVQAPAVKSVNTYNICPNADWEQCGGKEHTGATCCPPGSGCAYENPWYSHCVPGYTGECQPTWSQCGGEGWAGPTTCCDGGECVKQDQWYSQCTPPPMSNPPPMPMPPPSAKCQPMWSQCGGEQFTGPTSCCGEGECTKQDRWYSQCKPPPVPKPLPTPAKVVPVSTAATPVMGPRNRLCIFDFDDTIKIGAGRRIRLSKDAREIIRKCRDMGYGIAIASASCETDFQKAFLRDAVDGGIFSDDMLSSQAYQACQPDKYPALLKVLDHFDMENAPECAIFFDDKSFNGKFSAQADVPFVLVDPEYGVTWNDFWQGMTMLDKKCPMPEVA